MLAMTSGPFDSEVAPGYEVGTLPITMLATAKAEVVAGAKVDTLLMVTSNPVGADVVFGSKVGIPQMPTSDPVDAEVITQPMPTSGLAESKVISDKPIVGFPHEIVLSAAFFVSPLAP